jgi:hypothetical protein
MGEDDLFDIVVFFLKENRRNHVRVTFSHDPTLERAEALGSFPEILFHWSAQCSADFVGSQDYLKTAVMSQ